MHSHWWPCHIGSRVPERLTTVAALHFIAPAKKARFADGHLALWKKSSIVVHHFYAQHFLHHVRRSHPAFGLVKAYHAHIEVLKKRLIALLTLTYHWRYYRIQRETSWEAQVSPLCDIISGPEIWQRRIKYPVNPLLYGTTTCPSRSLCPNGVMTHACKRGSFIFAWAGLSDRGSNHINIKEGRHLKKKYANYQN